MPIPHPCLRSSLLCLRLLVSMQAPPFSFSFRALARQGLTPNTCRMLHVEGSLSTEADNVGSPLPSMGKLNLESGQGWIRACEGGWVSPPNTGAGVSSSPPCSLEPHNLVNSGGEVLDLQGLVYTGLSYPDNIPLTLDAIPEASWGIQSEMSFGAE